MAKPRIPADDLAVRIVLRWDPRRKIWTIVGARGTSVVTDTAASRLPIDRTDLIRLVGAVRNEIESWLPLPTTAALGCPPWEHSSAVCQADTPCGLAVID